MNPSVKAALILVVVFAIGGLSGFVVSKQFDGRSGRPIGPGLDPFRLESGIIDHIHGRLTNVYDLSEDQQQTVRTILEETQEQYEALYRETRPSLDQIRRAQQLAIQETMTEQQRERFEEWLDERRKRREARGDRIRREGGGPGGPGGHRGPRGHMAPVEEEPNN